MMLEEENCGACAFYMAAAKVCRRMPPTPIMLGVKQGLATVNPEPVIMAYFPSMLPQGWCGEFMEADPPKKEN